MWFLPIVGTPYLYTIYTASEKLYLSTGRNIIYKYESIFLIEKLILIFIIHTNNLHPIEISNCSITQTIVISLVVSTYTSSQLTNQK